ncbi:MAG: MBL fold metallo-hydrolase [Armatimonadetes bacterium]|nr:MBL fold metallo-hydrolase [Armatimonadota bacterium]
MKIKFMGHASFLITTAAGTKILTDPFNPDQYPDKLFYGKITEMVDIVTISHGHGDHGDTSTLPGNPMIIKGNGKFGADEVEFLGVETFHDAAHGAERGKNTEIGAVDVIMLPVGGYYTIDAKQAQKVAEQLGAKIIIPMHYRNEKCLFPISDVDEFLRGKANVNIADVSEIEVIKDNLPQQQQIIVLIPAL